MGLIEGSIADCGESRLHYRWAGRPSGPILVLSHSLGTSIQLWTAQEKTLGSHFRLLLFDHRGHGASSCPPGQWDIDDFGKDALELIGQLTSGPVHFCGVSLGGMVGLWLVQNAPDRIGRLVVANTSAWTEDPSLLRRRLKVIETEGLHAIAEDVLNGWFSEAFLKRERSTSERFRELLLATRAENYRRTAGAVCDLDLRLGLGKIASPTLVVTGRKDRATPPAWGEAIAAAVPNAQLVSLDSAHLSNVEAPEAFDMAVLEFLRS